MAMHLIPTMRLVLASLDTMRLYRISALAGLSSIVNSFPLQKPSITKRSFVPRWYATSSEEESSFATDYHAPVMWRECIEALLSCSLKPGHPRVFVDGTLGGGGHSAALLQHLEPEDVLFGCDVDFMALSTASQRLSEYTSGDKQKPLFVPIHSNFCNLNAVLREQQHPVTGQPLINDGVDGILLDLGVSSHQIDVAERGFAFMKDGPLDMRMNSEQGLTAAAICNEFDEREIVRILKVYGDEPRARKIASAIVERRPLTTTSDLVQAVAAVTPQFAKKGRRMGRTATLARVFQSLRIVVNHEDKVLEQALVDMAPQLLRPGGRLVVLTYHSLEDRATKRVMRDGSLDKLSRNDEKDIYGNYAGEPKPFRTLGKPRKATEDEVEANSRARSATLRVAERQ